MLAEQLQLTVHSIFQTEMVNQASKEEKTKLMPYTFGPKCPKNYIVHTTVWSGNQANG